MARIELDQRVARELLGDRESIIPSLAEADAEKRARIAGQKCPHCGEGLQPRIPSDPEQVFSTAGINYESVCPTHGVIAP